MLTVGYTVGQIIDHMALAASMSNLAQGVSGIFLELKEFSREAGKCNGTN